MNAVSETIDNVFNLKLAQFDASIRTKNCFQRADLITVGQLTNLSANDVINWQGAGKKTLTEVRHLLNSLGLNLSGDHFASIPENGVDYTNILSEPIEEPIPTKEILLANADAETQKHLVSKFAFFTLSVRAKGILVREKIKYLGQLIQLTPKDIQQLRNSGKKTVEELTALVRQFGFEFGTSIPDWSPVLVKQLEHLFLDDKTDSLVKQSNKLLESVGPTPNSLEEELERIACALTSERNAEVLIKLWGWNGKGTRVLESVGKEYQLTRERIRQIGAKALKKLGELKFQTSYIEASIAALQKEMPANSVLLEQKLLKLGLTQNRFNLAGLKSAAEYLGNKWPFREVKLGNSRIYFCSEDTKYFSKAIQAIRRRTSNLGCLNIASLASEVGLNENKVSVLRKFIDFIPGIRKLDETGDWIYIERTAQNRLFNLCSKVLAICPRLRVSELRRAVSRSRRLTMAPPQKILGAFVSATGLGQIERDFVISNPTMTVAPEHNSAEGKLLQVLDEFGPALAGDEFAEKCIAAGMNPITFYIYKLISPVVTTLGKNVYCKVGAEIPPGLVEEISRRQKTTHRISDHGWTPNGLLWFGVELSRSVITAGSIVLNQFVADLVQGEWSVDLPEGVDGGKVTCRETFIWTFRKAFSLLCVEPNDFLVLEFNIKSHHITAQTGGLELLESYQEPQPIDAEQIALAG